MSRFRARLGPLFVVLLTACGSEIDTERGIAPAAVAQQPSAETGGTATAATAETRSDTSPSPEPSSALTFSTVIYSDHDTDVRAQRSGVVATIDADLGDRVHAGREMATLENAKEQAAVAVSSAALDLARTRHDRLEQLAHDDMATRAELEEAVYQLRAAEADLRSTTVELERTRIRAPFAGIVTRRYVRLGQWVDEGAPLFRTTALAPLRADVRVPESEAGRLTIGLEVGIHGPAGEAAHGRVSRISPAVDPASGTVEAIIDIFGTGSLRPGSTATVLLPSAGTR